MASEKEAKPMADVGFRLMTYWYKVSDLLGFTNPPQRLQKVPLREGMTVVDYACGPGRYTLPAAKSVGPNGKVFAVDIQPLAVNMVKEKAARESLTNIETIVVDSYDTGIQGSSVDLVLLIDAFHHIGDRHALLREIQRILKQDGILFMDPGHMKMSRAKEIVESTGLFTITERRGNDMLLAPKVEE